MVRQVGAQIFDAGEIITIGMVNAGVRAHKAWLADPKESLDVSPTANLVYLVYEAMEVVRIAEHQGHDL